MFYRQVESQVVSAVAARMRSFIVDRWANAADLDCGSTAAMRAQGALLFSTNAAAGLRSLNIADNLTLDLVRMAPQFDADFPADATYPPSTQAARARCEVDQTWITDLDADEGHFYFCSRLVDSTPGGVLDPASQGIRAAAPVILEVGYRLVFGDDLSPASCSAVRTPDPNRPIVALMSYVIYWRDARGRASGPAQDHKRHIGQHVAPVIPLP